MRGVEMTLQSDRAREWSGWLTYAWARGRGSDRRRLCAALLGPSATRSRPALSGCEAPGGCRPFTTGTAGWPYTPLLASSDSWIDPTGVTLTLGPRNSARRPAFAALDLRASREWPFARGTLEASLELRNAFNRHNVCCTAYSVEVLPNGESHLVADEQGWLGLTPLIGLRWRY